MAPTVLEFRSYSVTSDAPTRCSLNRCNLSTHLSDPCCLSTKANVDTVLGAKTAICEVMSGIGTYVALLNADDVLVVENGILPIVPKCPRPDAAYR